MQIDLGTVQELEGVVTQPRGNNCCGPHVVTSYRVETSVDGEAFTYIPGTLAGPTADDFNADLNTLVKAYFPGTVKARYVR